MDKDSDAQIRKEKVGGTGKARIILVEADPKLIEQLFRHPLWCGILDADGLHQFSPLPLRQAIRHCNGPCSDYV